VLRWHEVKPLLAPAVSPALEELGFVHPGRTMWRIRQDFVDVVELRSDREGRALLVEFGCALRATARHQPTPDVCDFRTSPRFGLGFERLTFCASAEAQREQLRTLAPLIRDHAAQWFMRLDSFASALEALRRDPMRTAAAYPGSPTQRKLEAKLLALQS
jgi:hypothetical protein